MYGHYRRFAGLALTLVLFGGLLTGTTTRAQDDNGTDEDLRLGTFNILAYREVNDVPPTSW